MAISKVWIEEGCTACGACESYCPEVFTVEDTARVNKVDFSKYEAGIKDAADACPVEVIKYS